MNTPSREQWRELTAMVFGTSGATLGAEYGSAYGMPYTFRPWPALVAFAHAVLKLDRELNGEAVSDE